jgi:DNA-binding Lrp family transcriptional regulator
VRHLNGHASRANTQNGATQKEIARVVGCSVDPLHRRFAEVIKKGGAELNMRLHRSQVKAAVKQTKPEPGQTKLT